MTRSRNNLTKNLLRPNAATLALVLAGLAHAAALSTAQTRHPQADVAFSFSSSDFPARDPTRHGTELRMRFGPPDACEPLAPLWRTLLQFPIQMLPFVFELAARDFYGFPSLTRGAADLGTIEAVAAACGFGVDFLEIGRDVAVRERGFLKALELGMVLLALGFPLQHRLSQQRLSP